MWLCTCISAIGAPRTHHDLAQALHCRLRRLSFPIYDFASFWRAERKKFLYWDLCWGWDIHTTTTRKRDDDVKIKFVWFFLFLFSSSACLHSRITLPWLEAKKKASHHWGWSAPTPIGTAELLPIPKLRSLSFSCSLKTKEKQQKNC